MMTDSATQAQAKLESIVAMVKRLEHAEEECDWRNDDCKHVDNCAEVFGNRGGMPSEDDMDQYHAADAAREAIEQSALSVEVRSGWVTLEGWLALKDNKAWEQAAEYKILLSWGGPAVRIVGELDEHGEPETARLEHQDAEYVTPRNYIEGDTPAFQEWCRDLQTNSDALLAYARQFYYGG